MYENIFCDCRSTFRIYRIQTNKIKIETLIIYCRISTINTNTYLQINSTPILSLVPLKQNEPCQIDSCKRASIYWM